MKIVYFNYLYDLYGASLGSTRKAEYLLKEMENLGHDVKIYWRKKQFQKDNSIKQKIHTTLKKRLSKYLHDPKIIFSNVKYFFYEYKIIKKEQPDLIITRLETYIISSFLLSKLLKIPVIIEADAPNLYEERLFETDFYRIPRIPELIEIFILRHAEKSICVSNVAKNYFITQGVSKRKLVVITNGADIQKFSPEIDAAEIREKFNIGTNICIGFIGSFHHWHGVNNLMDLVKCISSIHSNIKFLMVGHGGPMLDTFKKFVIDNNLNNNVIFAGLITPDLMPKYIAAMDIVIAPYPNLELFYYSPVKIFEYMAAGKAVVATQIGQIAEIIQDRDNGLLFPAEKTEEMHTKILELIENSDLRTQIGRSARKTIESKYSWRAKAKQLSSICSAALIERKGVK